MIYYGFGRVVVHRGRVCVVVWLGAALRLLSLSEHPLKCSLLLRRCLIVGVSGVILSLNVG